MPCLVGRDTVSDTKTASVNARSKVKFHWEGTASLGDAEQISSPFSSGKSSEKVFRTTDHEREYELKVFLQTFFGFRWFSFEPITPIFRSFFFSNSPSKRKLQPSGRSESLRASLLRFLVLHRVDRQDVE